MPIQLSVTLKEALRDCTLAPLLSLCNITGRNVRSLHWTPTQLGEKKLPQTGECHTRRSKVFKRKLAAVPTQQRAGSTEKPQETCCACQPPLSPTLSCLSANLRSPTQRSQVLQPPQQCLPSLSKIPCKNLPSLLAQGQWSFCPWPDCTWLTMKSSYVASTLPASVVSVQSNKTEV